MFYLKEMPNQINLGHFSILPYHHVKSQPNLCNTLYNPLQSLIVFSETALKGKMSRIDIFKRYFMPKIQWVNISIVNKLSFW